MRRIEISEEVWNAIAQHGKFGETEDDVLRRLLGVPPQIGANGAGAASSSAPQRKTERPAVDRSSSRRRVATTRMSSFVQSGTLVVEFAGGPRKTFSLSGRDDKVALRRTRDEAVEFARTSGASYGQEMAVKKALTEAGYHLAR